MEITRGTLVEAVDARGSLVRLRALTGRVAGRDFPVVWVCADVDYTDDLEPADGVPWPADALSPLTPISA